MEDSSHRAHKQRMTTASSKDKIEYEINEAMRSELQQSWYENNVLKSNLTKANQDAETFRSNMLMMQRDVLFLKSKLAQSEMEKEKFRMAAAMAEKNAEAKFNMRAELLKKMMERARQKAERNMQNKQHSSEDVEEKVSKALKNAMTPLSKLKVMAEMVGVSQSVRNSADYRTLWKTVLMIVHEDKRRDGISPATQELYNFICKCVNDLPKK